MLVRVCVCACARACVSVCVRACVRACPRLACIQTGHEWVNTAANKLTMLDTGFEEWTRIPEWQKPNDTDHISGTAELHASGAHPACILITS